MKRFLLSAAIVALTTGAALAADLPTRKGPEFLPPPPPPPMWTGFYAGLNVGGTWANSTNINTGAGGIYYAPTWDTELAASNALATGQNNTNTGGFIGGGQIGYNYQIYNKFILGFEADIQGIASSSSRSGRYGALVPTDYPTELITSVASVSRSLDYIGTVRGRLGWLFTPTLLVYGTGGLAYGGVSASAAMIQQQYFGGAALDPAFFAGGSYSNTQVGWTAGGGLEWMFWPNWSAKVEYLYYDLGNVRFGTSALSNVAAGGFVRTISAVQSNTHFSGNIVRAGVNYHFNWGAAPVVAKY